MVCTAFYKLLLVQGTTSCSQRTTKLTIVGIRCFQSSMLTWLFRDCTSVEAVITDIRTRPPGKDHWCKPSSIRPLGILGERLVNVQRKNKEPGESHWYSTTFIPTAGHHSWNSPLLLQTSTSHIWVDYYAYYHNHEGTTWEKKKITLFLKLKCDCRMVEPRHPGRPARMQGARRHTAMYQRGNLLTL